MLVRALLILTMIVILLACSQEASTTRSDKLIEGKVALRIGVLPDQGEKAMRARYSGLFEYIKKNTGYDYNFVIPASYKDLLDRFIRNEVDMALFGGVTFIKASEKSGAIPLVLRDVDEQFTSVIVVKPDSTASSIEDLKGERFLFGSWLSTSGHLMPRYFMKNKNINPEEYFKETNYSGAHDKTVLSIRDGFFDAGVANSKVVAEMFRDGRIKEEEIKVLWTSPPYTDYVWAVQKTISPEIRKKLIHAFTNLTLEEADTKEILNAVGANYYLRAKKEGFQELENIMREMNI